MSKQATRPCPKCGSEMTEDTAGGLCPKCLMALNFETRTMPEGESAASVPPLSPEEMREHFPQFEIIECLGRGDHRGDQPHHLAGLLRGRRGF